MTQEEFEDCGFHQIDFHGADASQWANNSPIIQNIIHSAIKKTIESNDDGESDDYSKQVQCSHAKPRTSDDDRVQLEVSTHFAEIKETQREERIERANEDADSSKVDKVQKKHERIAELTLKVEQLFQDMKEEHGAGIQDGNIDGNYSLMIDELKLMAPSSRARLYPKEEEPL